MKITYIITTYNRPELLKRAVGFVVRERCADAELIIVDDNSQVPVKLPDLAMAAFPDAHRLIRNQTNLGVIGARNVGVAAASGQYIIFLDDDDESLPNRTTDLLSQIENSAFDFVAARSYMGKGEEEKIVPADGGFLLTPEKLLGAPSHINAVIWRREMFAGNAGLDNRVPYFGEHISLVLCLLHGGKGWLSDAVVARFDYIAAGLTQQTQQQNTMKKHLIELYQVLLDESETPAFRQFAERVLTMLRKEDILTFEDYLQQLQPIVRRYRST